MTLAKMPYRILSILVGLLLIVIPQVAIGAYPQATITSKFVVFAFSVLGLFGFLILLYVFSKPQKIQISKLDIGLLALFGYVTINRYAIHTDPSFSIRYMELVGLVCFYIIARILSLRAFVGLLLAVIISAIIQAIYGNLQLLGYYSSNHAGFKMTGSFFNPGPYAGFLATVWPIALGMYLFQEKVIEQVVSGIKKNNKRLNRLIAYTFEYIPLLGIVSIFFVLPASQSRGAWLAVLLSSLFLLEWRYHYIRSRFYKITRAKQMTLIVGAIIILGTGLFGVYHLKKGSADGRLFIWKTTSEMIKDFPVTGVGFDRFKAHYMNYQADYFVKHGETKDALVADNTYYTFNDWLQFAAENGTVGLLLLGLLLYRLCRIQTRPEHDYWRIVIKGSLLSIGGFALFSYPMQILPIKLVLVLLVAFLARLDVNNFTIVGLKKYSSPYVLWGVKIAVFILCCVVWANAMWHLQALDRGFKTWQNALNTYQYVDYEGATEASSRAYAILHKNGDFLMNYGKALAMDGQNKKAVQVLEQAKKYLNTTIIETALGDAYKEMKQYKKADMAYQQAADMIPVRFYPLYLQAKLYKESGQNRKAIMIAKTLLKKDVKVPSTAIREIKTEMKEMIVELKSIISSPKF